jgi:drug/metabolite transporter (DMT)-like permease
METVEVKNCKKIKERKLYLLTGIATGFGIFLSIFNALDVPSSVSFPIGLFLVFILVIISFLLFGNEKK